MHLNVLTEVGTRSSLFSNAEMWDAYLFLLSAGGLLWNFLSTLPHCLYCIFARTHKQSIRLKDFACFINDIGMRQTRVKTVMVGKLIDKRLWSVWSAKNFWRTTCEWMSCHRRSYVHILSHLIIGQRCCWCHFLISKICICLKLRNFSSQIWICSVIQPFDTD